MVLKGRDKQMITGGVFRDKKSRVGSCSDSGGHKIGKIKKTKSKKNNRTGKRVAYLVSTN